LQDADERSLPSEILSCSSYTTVAAMATKTVRVRAIFMVTRREREKSYLVGGGKGMCCCGLNRDEERIDMGEEKIEMKIWSGIAKWYLLPLACQS
jgi:hypothetical protein